MTVNTRMRIVQLSTLMEQTVSSFDSGIRVLHRKKCAAQHDRQIDRIYRYIFIALSDNFYKKTDLFRILEKKRQTKQ